MKLKSPPLSGTELLRPPVYLTVMESVFSAGKAPAAVLSPAVESSETDGVKLEDSVCCSSE